MRDMEDLWNYELFTIGEKHFLLGNLILIIGIILLARGIVWMIAALLRKRLRPLKSVDLGRRYAITAIAKYFIYTLAAMLVLETAGVNVTVLVAGSTALFVGLGFGLQNTFNDFISGIILLFEGSLEIHDVVELNGVVGKVTRIGLRTSTIQTRDDVNIIVPNSKFVSDNVINWSHQQDLTRFRLPVSVAYGSDLNLVRETLLSVAKMHADVHSQHEPIVFFQDFGESGLRFELLFWTRRTFLAEQILSDLRFDIDREFKALDIRIPFPQRDLHIRSDLRKTPAPEAKE